MYRATYSLSQHGVDDIDIVLSEAGFPPDHKNLSDKIVCSEHFNSLLKRNNDRSRQKVSNANSCFKLMCAPGEGEKGKQAFACQ